MLLQGKKIEFLQPHGPPQAYSIIVSRLHEASSMSSNCHGRKLDAMPHPSVLSVFRTGTDPGVKKCLGALRTCLLPAVPVDCLRL